MKRPSPDKGEDKAAQTPRMDTPRLRCGFAALVAFGLIRHAVTSTAYLLIGIIGLVVSVALYFVFSDVPLGKAER